MLWKELSSSQMWSLSDYHNMDEVIRCTNEAMMRRQVQDNQVEMSAAKREHRFMNQPQSSFYKSRKRLKQLQLQIPDKVNMCLCGLLSLSLSVHLICCIEVFFSLILLMQSPDLLNVDGRYFYFLGLLDGDGVWLFALQVIMCSSCVFTALLLYLGSRNEISLLILPHLFWQYAYIVVSSIISTVLMMLGFYRKMLLPSSIVLSLMLLIPAVFEIWWSNLTICYYRHLTTKNEYKLRSAMESSALSSDLVSTPI
ncbi:unnamed protein product [Cylicocyclus nassatus]|uniref:Uncharacterized protein n=1 Tax=Cylicocyclus nassatus TaxID=53992 RepID=A0AA36DML4_CYLNA|nr:unnamed protein product [Cylicocyclus nassatus]